MSSNMNIRSNAAMRRVEEVKRIAQSEVAKRNPDLALVAIAEKRTFKAFAREVEMLSSMRARR